MIRKAAQYAQAIGASVAALALLAALAACQGTKPSLVITPGPGPHGTVNLDMTAEGTFPKNMTRQRVVVLIRELGKIDAYVPPQFKDMQDGRAVFHFDLPQGRYRVAASMRVYINHGQSVTPKRFEGITAAERFTIGEGGSIENIQVVPQEGE